MTENTFPLDVNNPVNLRIMLHAADSPQMSSTSRRKVKYNLKYA